MSGIPTGEPKLRLWEKRATLFSGTLGAITCVAIIAAMTNAVLYIHENKSRMKRVAAEVVSVDSMRRSSFGKGLKPGKYSLTVKYRDSGGQDVTASLEHMTYSMPTTGESITLLIDPEYGRVEPNPFPELWIVMIAVYAGFGWLTRFFLKNIRTAFRGSPA